jgi:hypothetical protein
MDSPLHTVYGPASQGLTSCSRPQDSAAGAGQAPYVDPFTSSGCSRQGFAERITREWPSRCEVAPALGVAAVSERFTDAAVAADPVWQAQHTYPLGAIGTGTVDRRQFEYCEAGLLFLIEYGRPGPGDGSRPDLTR